MTNTFKTRTIKQNTFSKNIVLYVDGASRIENNQITPDTVGSFSYHLSQGGREKSGAVVTLGKTNNYNEIMALYKGLSQLKSTNVSIVAYSDSAYVVNCIQQGWWKKWEKDGWTKEGGLKNAEQWKNLIALISTFDSFAIEKVKGHSTNEMNNLVDFLNNQAMDDYIAGKEVEMENNNV